MEWVGEVEVQDQRWVRSMLKGMLTFELMSKGVLMLMVMLMVMLSWVGGGGDRHLLSKTAGT